MPAAPGNRLIPLDLPILGMDVQSPQMNMPAGGSPWLLNVDVEPGFIAARSGFGLHCEVDDFNVTRLLNHGNTKLFAYSLDSGNDSEVYDVTSATETLETTTISTDNAAAGTFKFANRSAFIASANPSTAGQIYNGSSWSAWNFTESATVRGALCATSYKGRVYFSAGTIIYYSELEAVTGACSEFDVEAFLEEDSNIVWMTNLTSNTQNSNETYLAFGNALGDVLIYGGDFPGAANWELIAKLKIQNILNANSFLTIFNDVWILTYSGVISLRQLLASASQRVNEISPSYRINKHWVDTIAQAPGTAATSAAIAYWPEKDKIYIRIKGFLDEDGTYTGTFGTMFVFNRINSAWSIYKVPGDSAQPSLTYFSNGLYYVAGGGEIFKYTEGTYKDEQSGNLGNYDDIDVDIYGPYRNLKDKNPYKEFSGFDAILKTDFGASKMGLIAAADFGREVRAINYRSFQDGFNKPYYRSGISGEYLQWRMTGVADQDSSDGYKLFSVGATLKT